MTWLEILQVLEKMPYHLLKDDAVLWAYDVNDDIETVPIHHLVNPADDPNDPNWKKGGDYRLSLQSFADSKPKETFLIQTSTILGQQFAIEADSVEDAREKAKRLVNDKAFFDEHMHAKWSYDNEWDAAEVIDVVTGWDLHDDECFVSPTTVDKYLK
jgi:hypothetical protein